MEMLKMAVEETQIPLVIDTPTIADGNCFPHAIVQQVARPDVKAFLERTGRNIATFLQLKNKVTTFVEENEDSDKIKALRENFELSQQNIHNEKIKGLRRRTWKQYWKDMRTDGKWADDTFIQATAFYLNMDIIIIFAAQATREHPFGRMEGNFSSNMALNREAPTLIVGYMNTTRNNEHYQSILPVEKVSKSLKGEEEKERKGEEKSKNSIMASTALDDLLLKVLKVLKAVKGQTVVSFAPTFLF